MRRRAGFDISMNLLVIPLILQAAACAPDAAPPGIAEPLYDEFVAELRGRDLPVETGRFRASMRVASVNDGPVTVLLTTRAEDTR